MSDHLEQQIGDLIVDGKMTEDDAEIIRAFREFLAETPAGLTGSKGDLWPDLFPDRAAFEAWRVKWLPYLVGLAQGPSTPEEWPAYRDRIREMR